MLKASSRIMLPFGLTHEESNKSCEGEKHKRRLAKCGEVDDFALSSREHSDFENQVGDGKRGEHNKAKDASGPRESNGWQKTMEHNRIYDPTDRGSSSSETLGSGHACREVGAQNGDTRGEHAACAEADTQALREEDLPVCGGQGEHHLAEDDEEGSREDEGADVTGVVDGACKDTAKHEERALEGSDPGDGGWGFFREKASFVVRLVRLDQKGRRVSGSNSGYDRRLRPAGGARETISHDYRPSTLRVPYTESVHNAPCVHNEHEGGQNLKPCGEAAVRNEGDIVDGGFGEGGLGKFALIVLRGAEIAGCLFRRLLMVFLPIVVLSIACADILGLDLDMEGRVARHGCGQPRAGRLRLNSRYVRRSTVRLSILASDQRLDGPSRGMSKERLLVFVTWLRRVKVGRFPAEG